MKKIKDAGLNNIFKKRKNNSHKGNYGKVFILAGSEGMLGAGILCSRAALKVGAGLVYLGVPKSARDIVNIATPEAIIFGIDSIKDIPDSILASSAIAIGPGLGSRRKMCKELLLYLKGNNYKNPVILDADGINAFVNDLDILKSLGLDLIITPHPGELARLLSKPVEEIQTNREKITRETALGINCTVVLKGCQTVIADKNGKVFLNTTGNPGMATAGSGDVLCGMIAGIAAQGHDAINSAIAGVFLHGLAGDLAAKKYGEYGMISSNILETIPEAIKHVNKC
ncbi:MAG: carbohydrate kinase-like protein [Candidatus Saganbacteria bacterium]|uniref:ADP-dependent (S)-NAD(P)H-hydrate dehydratase n=1 Tax=Candidatus Saganbacteria bacterium TaxID=2575572 RepID=A0A833L110_UNCSA|nr:MAG: carbohydrate kinase-like protein [Candidatus Saganbacteria bacterium]